VKVTTEGANASNMGYMIELTSVSNNPGYSLGVLLFTGADYWINISFYVGGQLGIGCNISSNDTEEGRALNRKVELLLSF